MEVLTKRVNADNILEYANLPEFADRRVELVEGEIVTMGLPRGLHGAVLLRLATEIGIHLKETRMGGMTGADAAFVLERSEYRGDTVRGLDIAVVGNERANELYTNEVIEGAPDLAVEIVSPSNTISDMKRKTRQLLEAGAIQVWIVDPDLREVDVYTRAGSVNYREGDTLSAGDALPGFEIAVANIFP